MVVFLHCCFERNNTTKVLIKNENAMKNRVFAIKERRDSG